MADVLTREQRVRCMSHIRANDSKPEMIVRRTVHAMGFRYRLHERRLPGTPDLVFAGRKKIIFVHGCFWHRHSCPKGLPMPATRTEFWRAKFEATVARDRRVQDLLHEAGWQALVVWECETTDQEHLAARLKGFLS